MTCTVNYPYGIQRGEKKIEKSRGYVSAKSFSKKRSWHQAIAFYAVVGNKSGVGSALEYDSPTWSAAPAGGETASSTGVASS